MTNVMPLSLPRPKNDHKSWLVPIPPPRPACWLFSQASLGSPEYNHYCSPQKIPAILTNAHSQTDIWNMTSNTRTLGAPMVHTVTKPDSTRTFRNWPVLFKYSFLIYISVISLIFKNISLGPLRKKAIFTYFHLFSLSPAKYGCFRVFLARFCHQKWS